MAKPGTTHVIEIETGIGEPAFIPLTMGSELQPISVGKKGMWRIESARVLDVHAFVYFDGTSLFLQSADESQAASVDGYRVGKAWTELHPPCKIEIGAARLRFRSLADAPSEAKPVAAARPAAGAPMPAPVHAHPPSGSTRVGDSRPVDVAGGSGAINVPQRSTRATGQLLSSGAAPVQAIPASQHPPGLMNNAIMSGVHNLGPTLPPNMAFGGPQMMPGGPPMMGGPQMMPGGPQMMGQPMGPMGPLSSGSMNVGAMGSGSYGSMGQGSRIAPTIQTGERHAVQEGGFAEQIAKYKELSPPKRLLVLMSPFCLIAAAYLLLFDDDEPVADPGPTPAMEAGAANTPPIPIPAPQPQPGQPPGNPCQPGFAPYPVPVNGQIQCVPITAPAPQPAPGPQPAAGPGPKPGPSAKDPNPKDQPPDPTPPPTGNVKTLERQAVDAVAVNDYARAAAIYDQLLAQSNPKNPVYAEAARILRQKAAQGGGPPPQ